MQGYIDIDQIYLEQVISIIEKEYEYTYLYKLFFFNWFNGMCNEAQFEVIEHIINNSDELTKFILTI